MIRNKLLKFFTYLALVIFVGCQIIPITVLAEGDEVIAVETPFPPDEPTPPGSEPACNFTAAGSTDIESCGINVKNKYKSTVYMNIYDQDGTYLGNPLFSIFLNKEFKAGTYVGIDFFEEFRTISQATINPTCTRRTVTLTCTKEIYVPCASSSSSAQASNQSGPIVKRSSSGMTQRESYKKPSKAVKAIPMVSTADDPGPGKNCNYYYTDTKTVTEGSCPEGYTATATCTYSACDSPPTVSSCRDQAERALKIASDNEDEHYTAQMRDVNNINVPTFKNIKPNWVFNEGEVLPTDRNARTITRESYLRIKYNPSKACIDVKTAKIHYGDECNTEKENKIFVKEIKNDEGEPIGLYFIPLNAKTGQLYQYKMTSNQRIEGDKIGLCSRIIDKYKEDGRWRHVLLDQDGNKIPNNITADYAKKHLIARGCYYQTEVNFIINQDFYNEVGRTTKRIKGYDLFYRPIDISNPFPNGISDNSYWNGLIENNIITVTNASKQTKKYNLNDSFKDMTYSIYYINANEIRNYTYGTEKPYYTSWVTMNKNGTSEFVNKYSMRRGTRDFYKLGCGPANSDWEECK